MKKVILLAGMMLTGVCAQAQLRVTASGNTIAKNLSLVGTTGVDSTGVLTITSTNAEYGADGVFPPTFIVTKTNDDVYPFVHYKDGNPIFFVNAAGGLYAPMYVSVSDSTTKTNISPLDSSLEKLSKLHGVSFNFKSDLEKINMPIMAETPEIRKQIEEERTRKRAGLIAQEVEKVFPEVVRTQFNGTKGIIYTDLIGILIDAVNELQDSLSVQGAQIATLQNQVNAMQAVFFANNGSQPQLESQSTNVDLSQAVLYQNSPNPFKHETTIAYRLPSDIQSAAICIYNLNGQQLKKYDLDASVIANSVTVEASSLTAGIYIYALIIDGQMVASKRMALTE